MGRRGRPRKGEERTRHGVPIQQKVELPPWAKNLDGISGVTKYILFSSKNFPLYSIALFGFMGTGKTNLIKLLTRDLDRLGWEIRYVFPTPKEVLDDPDAPYKYGIGALSEPAKKPWLFIAMDDYSFVVRSAKNRKDASLMFALTRARHSTKAQKIISLFAVHDLTAISPFIRSSQMFLFTSVDKTTKQRLWQYFSIGGPTITQFALLRRTRMDVVLACDRLTGDCVIFSGVPLVEDVVIEKYRFVPEVEVEL